MSDPKSLEMTLGTECDIFGEGEGRVRLTVNLRLASQLCDDSAGWTDYMYVHVRPRYLVPAVHVHVVSILGDHVRTAAGNEMKKFVV